MLNFKSETQAKIAQFFSNATIDEWLFRKDYVEVKGSGPIDWDLVKERLPFQKDFDYDEGYGADDITGFITFKNDGSWLERHEYDGSSWWKCVVRPSISPSQS